MKRALIAVAILIAVPILYVMAHGFLIEAGREVIVLRTRQDDGGWLETRLWIIDDGSQAWIHGGSSQWMHNLTERPVVEVERDGETRRYRAVPVPGPHARVHELLREKYGLADRWVRFVGGDEGSIPVRLDAL